MLPESFDPSALRTMVAVAVGVIVVLALLVMRLVQKMVLKVVFLGALAGLALYVWSERPPSVDECRATCACTFAGFDLQVPGCVKDEPAPSEP